MRTTRVESRRPTRVVLFGALIALLFLLLPVVMLVARAPLNELWTNLGKPSVREATLLSVQTSLAATALCFVLGLPLARLLASGPRLAPLIRLVALLPLALPPVVGGTALLLALGRRSPLGEALYDLLGWTLFGTPAAVVIAQAFIAMPFFILAAEAGIRGVDERYEEVAATLGAGRGRAFRTVTLPLAGPALAAGTALAFMRALGEFGATITFAGNLPGSTQTIPLAVFIELQRDPDAAAALSLLLLTLSILVVALLRKRWWTT